MQNKKDRTKIFQDKINHADLGDNSGGTVH